MSIYAPFLNTSVRPSFPPQEVGGTLSKLHRSDGSIAGLPLFLEKQIHEAYRRYSFRNITDFAKFEKHLNYTPSLLRDVGRYEYTENQKSAIDSLVRLYATKLLERRRVPVDETLSKYQKLLI